MLLVQFLHRKGAIRRSFLLLLCVIIILLIVHYLIFDPSANLPNIKLADKTSDRIDSNYNVCDLGKTCSNEELFIAIEASVSENNIPAFCINDTNYSKRHNMFNILIVALLNEKTQNLLEIHYFPISTSDGDFFEFLSHITDEKAIILAFHGHAQKISTESRALLQKFGSKFAFNWKKNTSFVLIGQKGLKIGQAVENISIDSEGKTRIFGCFKFPLGDGQKNSTAIQTFSNIDPLKGRKSVQRKKAITYGQELPHCGMKEPCPEGYLEGKLWHYPLFGSIIDRDLNSAGRGMNTVVFDPKTRQVITMGHFDTYLDDSSTLEIYLEEMLEGEIILIVTFDEASNKLSHLAKQLLYELGSGLVQNLKFRASWYFVGQKGIRGFSPFEGLNFPSGNYWAKPIDDKICIPERLDGKKIRPDPIVRLRNSAKRHFCSKYDGYDDFCDGLAYNSLRLSMETVLKQEGLDPNMVLVAYDENYQEAKPLSQLFSYRSIAVNSTSSYAEHLANSIDQVWTVFPDSEMALIIEEELLVTSDFLYYMSQLVAVYKNDDTISTVSAWNRNGSLGIGINGFPETSTFLDSVYRVESQAPGLGFLLKRSFYDAHIRGQMHRCCMERAWESWPLPGFTLVPEVSRISRRYSGTLTMDGHNEQIFKRQRLITRDAHILLKNTDNLHSKRYDSYLSDEIMLASEMTMDNSTCKKTSILNSLLDGQSAVIFYRNAKENDEFLSRCFDLVNGNANVYRHVLRFSLKQHSVFLVNSYSPFYHDSTT